MGRTGAPRPTRSRILEHQSSRGKEAVKAYEASGEMRALPWQEGLLDAIMAEGGDGLWTHMKFGYSLPRRNGKNEVVVMRELWGLENGESILHTAHKTTTSSTAWKKLVNALSKAGYVELGRKKKGEVIPEKAYRTTKQFGLETVSIPGKGSASFRTRTDSGGLGEGYDLLVVDEAQEYTKEQESALTYVVSASPNPQTLMLGTPPTMTSAGTVFRDYRDRCLSDGMEDCGWAEWGVEESPKDLTDRELWYGANPSLGYHLTERVVRSELQGDRLDFVIQRLGFWHRYSLRSAVSAAEWEAMRCGELPELSGRLSIGIKFGGDGENVSMAIACRTWDGRIFVEAIDCRSVKSGTDWILTFLREADYDAVTADGKSGVTALAAAMRDVRLKKPKMPTASEYISANALFEKAVSEGQLCHMGQPSLTQVVTNCEKRAIGSGGGFGYRSLKKEADISLMDAVILAAWNCSEKTAPKRSRQKIDY